MGRVQAAVLDTIGDLLYTGDVETDETQTDQIGVAEAAAGPAAADAEEAAASPEKEPQPPHIVHARRFWILSLVNWAIAIVCFGLSSYLGVARPTNMFVYTIIFVIAIVAVLVGFLCWIVAKFGIEPTPVGDH